MKLYYSPGACSLSPHIVLNELGIPAELVQVDTKIKKTKKGDDFLAVNPKGQVPTLQLDNGDVLTEGPAIVQYLADQKPDGGLAPRAGTIERYHLQEWLNYITSELHKGFSPLWKPNTPENYKAIAKENLAKQYDYVNGKLAGRSYLMGEQFTVADAYLFTITNWAKFQNIDISRWPNVKAFMERVAQRPKVKQAMDEEGLK